MLGDLVIGRMHDAGEVKAQQGLASFTSQRSAPFRRRLLRLSESMSDDSNSLAGSGSAHQADSSFCAAHQLSTKQ
jgi:hypothetical protein